MLPGLFLPIAQLLLLRRSLWPGSASLPRLRSCLAWPMPLARPRQIKKVSIKCDQNFKVVENLFSSQRSALGCVSIKPETPLICLVKYVGTQLLAFQGPRICCASPKPTQILLQQLQRIVGLRVDRQSSSSLLVLLVVGLQSISFRVLVCGTRLVCHHRKAVH